MATVIKVEASSPAVIQFQKLNAAVNNKIQEAGSNKSYWTGYYNEQSNKIAAQYGIPVSDLVDSWVSWVDAVEQARKGSN
jgi:lysophospholipase L1-like esterase